MCPGSEGEDERERQRRDKTGRIRYKVPRPRYRAARTSSLPPRAQAAQAAPVAPRDFTFQGMLRLHWTLFIGSLPLGTHITNLASSCSALLIWNCFYTYLSIYLGRYVARDELHIDHHQPSSTFLIHPPGPLALAMALPGMSTQGPTTQASKPSSHASSPTAGGTWEGRYTPIRYYLMPIHVQMMHHQQHPPARYLVPNPSRALGPQPFGQSTVTGSGTEQILCCSGRLVSAKTWYPAHQGKTLVAEHM